MASPLFDDSALLLSLFREGIKYLFARILLFLLVVELLKLSYHMSSLVMGEFILIFSIPSASLTLHFIIVWAIICLILDFCWLMYALNCDSNAMSLTCRGLTKCTEIDHPNWADQIVTRGNYYLLFCYYWIYWGSWTLSDLYYHFGRGYLITYWVS